MLRLRYGTLLDRLGTAFDGNPTMPGVDDSVTDHDMLYCVVEGMAGTAVAEARAALLAFEWG